MSGNPNLSLSLDEIANKGKRPRDERGGGGGGGFRAAAATHTHTVTYYLLTHTLLRPRRGSTPREATAIVLFERSSGGCSTLTNSTNPGTC